MTKPEPALIIGGRDPIVSRVCGQIVCANCRRDTGMLQAIDVTVPEPLRRYLCTAAACGPYKLPDRRERRGSKQFRRRQAVAGGATRLSLLQRHYPRAAYGKIFR